MKRKTSEPKVSKWIPLWKNYHGKGYIEPQEVITLKDACEITRGLLYDMEYGYSMDDLTVKLERFMNDRSFTAIEYNDEDLEDVSRFF